MLDRLTSTLNFQAEALVLRSERQRLIASNIANADTPGYVARDMDFAKQLQAATRAQSAGGAVASAKVVATTSAGHIGNTVNGRAPVELNYALASQTNLDSNTVDMDRERANFADNSVRYEATLRFINGSVKTMLSAITGQ
ncbi:flagellar basal body rod protein FlgB [Aquabacterium sp. A7-Y]|uniref:flagellar basal body rod protein FlgB n=1 Tax=Aquabacterium sp. A7-Y TaxID=1349605 RepID=UPI00223D31B4|nr:flagellar basal body rod protein FlgB [Aquabacterium sp. A7-Y]MCW7540515.1 flagellar basal body rod protein FlgB [Aquabacterium sp. A7-Y]